MSKNKVKKYKKINEPTWTDKKPKEETFELKRNVPKKPNIIKNDKTKYLIWHIQGGLGKNVASTSLLQSLKDKYSDRKLIVVASWPEVFLNHPSIDRLYPLGQIPHFYDDYIHNKDSIVFQHEAYNQTAHVHRSQHLIHNWCDLMDLDYQKQVPQVILNYAQQQLPQRWARNKPTMVLHTNGGPFVGQKFPYNWPRDMPIEIANNIVAKYSESYHIFQICRKDSYVLNGVERVDEQMSSIELFSILAQSEKRILIDSCLQHAAVAFNLPSTVFWIGTSPVVFGYDLHNNISAKEPKLNNQRLGSYMFDYQFENNVQECPYLTINDMFDINYIMNNI